MTQRLGTAFLSVLTLGWSIPASADPITLVTNSSGIAALTYAAERGVISTPAYPFTANGNNAVTISAVVGGTTATASASIASDVTDLSRLQGRGTTDVAYATQIGQGEAVGDAAFFVAFQLAIPHEYRFAADFVTSGGATVGPPSHRTDWNFDLMSLDPWRSQEPAVMIENGQDSATVMRSGLLAPGYYRFAVESVARAVNLPPVGPAAGSASSNFTFNLDLTALAEPPAPTPEPTSLLLIGTGLGALFAARRRSRRV